MYSCLAAAAGHVYRSTLTLHTPDTHTHTHTDTCVRAPLYHHCPTVATTAQRKWRSVSHGRSRCPMTFEIQSAAPSSDGNHKPSVAISFPPLHTTPPPSPYNVCAHSCMYPAAELASLQCPLGWTWGEKERQKREREWEREREGEIHITHTCSVEKAGQIGGWQRKEEATPKEAQRIAQNNQ